MDPNSPSPQCLFGNDSSPPKGLGPDTDIVLRKLNLKMCVCGRQAKAMCARCYMQPYCALNCQVRLQSGTGIKKGCTGG